MLNVYSAIAQINFSKKIDAGGGGDYFMCQDYIGDYVITRGLPGDISFYKISANGSPVWAKSYGVQNPMIFGEILIQPDLSGYVLLAETISSTPDLVLLSVDNLDQKEWDIKILNNSADFNVIDNIGLANDGSYIIGCHDLSFHVFLKKINSDGEIIYERKYDVATSQGINSICVNAEGDVILTGWISTQVQGMFDAFIMKADVNGNIIWSYAYEAKQFAKVQPFNDGTYLLQSESQIPNDTVLLARISDDGDFMWFLQFDSNDIAGNYASIDDDNNILIPIFSDVQSMDFIKLDIDGMFVEGWRYPSEVGIANIISTGDNGLLFLSTNIDNTGLLTSLIKSDSSGFSGVCPALPICSKDYSFLELPSSYPISFNVENVMSVDTAFEEHIIDVNFSTEDFCQPINIPSPEFEFPDTICQNNSTVVSNLNQISADLWQWYFEGGFPDFSSEQSPDSIDYETSGVFEVRQVIEKLGCLDTFSRQIVVLPELNLNLPDDTLFCHDEFYGVELFDLGYGAKIEWDDLGVTDLNREFQEEGTYSVIVSNFYCVSEDSVNISFFENIVSSSEEIISVSDTVLCDYEEFEIDLFFEDINGYVWNDGYVGENRVINESGFYSVNLSKKQCSIADTINVIFRECLPDIYVPNAFSPNGDGINDEFKIYGKNISIQKMEIYDRWGGLLFETENDLLGWDGMAQDKLAPNGVYIYLIKYFDEKNNQIKLLSGETNLIK